MRHPYIKKAKKNSHLMDLIDRYKKWRLTRGDESETDSGGESGGDNTEDGSDTDWNMTVKGPPSVYTGTDSISYSEPINSVNVNSERVSNGDMSRETSVTSSDRSSRSPSKDVRAISPEKHIIPTGLSPAKSEQQIVSFELWEGLKKFKNCYNYHNLVPRGMTFSKID